MSKCYWCPKMTDIKKKIHTKTECRSFVLSVFIHIRISSHPIFIVRRLFHINSWKQFLSVSLWVFFHSAPSSDSQVALNCIWNIAAFLRHCSHFFFSFGCWSGGCFYISKSIRNFDLGLVLKRCRWKFVNSNLCLWAGEREWVCLSLGNGNESEWRQYDDNFWFARRTAMKTWNKIIFVVEAFFPTEVFFPVRSVAFILSFLHAPFVLL